MENIPLSNTPDNASETYFPLTPSKSDTFSASFSESFENLTGVGALANLGVKTYIGLSGKGTMVPPEELNRMYPHMDEPFQQPTNSEVAAYMAWNKTESMKREEVMANGDAVPRVLGSIVGTLADPVGLAAAYVTGGVSEAFMAKSGATAGLAGLAAKGGAVAEAAKATQTFGQALVGGVAAQAITEPIVALNKAEMQQNYSLEDAIKNVAMGAALEGSAIYLGGKFLRFLKGKGPEAEKAAFSTAIAQKLQGKQVDVESFGKMLAKEEGGVAVNQPLPGEDFHYSVTKGNDPSFKTGTQKEMFDNILPGVHVTDNESAALAQASSSTGDGVGVVSKLRIPKDVNMLNLDIPLPDDLGRKIFSTLEAVYKKDAEAVLKNVEGKEILSDLRDSVKMGSITEEEFNNVKKAMQDSGYDGAQYQATKHMGADIPSQKTSVIFDKNKLEEVRSYQPSQDNTYKIPKDEIKSFGDKQNSIVSEADYNEQALKDIEKAPARIEEQGPLVQSSEIDKKIQAFQEQRQFLSPEHQKEFDALTEAHAVDNEFATATKSFINCLIGATGGK